MLVTPQPVLDVDSTSNPFPRKDTNARSDALHMPGSFSRMRFHPHNVARAATPTGSLVVVLNVCSSTSRLSFPTSFSASLSMPVSLLLSGGLIFAAILPLFWQLHLTDLPALG